MINALDIAMSKAWAMEPEAYQRLLEIAQRQGDPEALAAKLGKPLENTRTAYTRGGVGVIQVTGPIFRYANIFTKISGATSTGVLAQDFRTALDDDAVKAILLEINSPGGEASGVNELAQMIRDARGKKPIVAYVDGMAASGAYWIASAADRIVMDRTAMVGSIGVVGTYRDDRERQAREGIKSFEIVSSQSPRKRPDPGTESGRAQLQATIDRLAEEFIASVASNRGVSAEVVASEQFGHGGMKVGTDAVHAHMADAIGSFEQVLSDLAAGGSGVGNRKAVAAAVTPTQEHTMTEKPAAAVPAAPEKPTEPVVDTAAIATNAAKAERERVKAIQAAAFPGQEALTTKLIDDGASAGDAALQLNADHKAKGAHLAALAADGKGPAPSAAVPGDKKPDLSHLPIEERCKAEWEKDAALRAEFGDVLDRYVAFEKANAVGAIRILRDRRAA